MWNVSSLPRMTRPLSLLIVRRNVGVDSTPWAAATVTASMSSLSAATEKGLEEDDHPTRTQIRKMRKAELQEALSSRGLDVVGDRDALVARLIGDIHEPVNDPVSTNIDRINKQVVPDIPKNELRFKSDRVYVLRFRGYTSSTYDTGGTGLVLYDLKENKEVWSACLFFLQEQTRFETEYRGLIEAMRFCQNHGVRLLMLQSDNEIILKQMRGDFEVRKDRLQKLYWCAMSMKDGFDNFDVQKISVSQNSRANNLARKAVATQMSHGLDFSHHLPSPELARHAALFGLEGRFAEQQHEVVQQRQEQIKLEMERERRKDPTESLGSQPYLSTNVQSPTLQTNEATGSGPNSVSGEESSHEFRPDKEYLLRFDGGSRGNPGIAGAGMVLYDRETGKEVWCGWKYLDEVSTNNEAEYAALLVGLKCAKALGITHLLVEGDSNLVVKQMNGTYKVKAANLGVLHKSCSEVVEGFEYCHFQHIRRAKNARADELANHAMDSEESWGFDEDSGASV